MDGMHDLGGKQGFGRVRFVRSKEIYHHPWQLKANALSGGLVAAGVFNMDEYRHAIERMEPRHYLTADYYERVLTACASLCVEKGVTSAQELERLAGGAFPLAGPAAPGRHGRADAQDFAIGQRVRVRNEFVPGHHRMPGYIRGKVGVVVRRSTPFPFPDAAGHAMGDETEPTFEVRFETSELWPETSDEATVTVAVFRSYLQVVE